MFVVAPLLAALVMRRGLLFPALWLLGAVCMAGLLWDRTFHRTALWNAAGARAALPGILLRFAAGAGILTGLLLLLHPERLLELPRERTALWAVIMVGYPVLSVYPQELAFRTFFAHRYAAVFPSRTALIAASALAFGWAHLVIPNVYALTFSTVGGVLFAYTYATSRSTLAACLEHALFGCFLFTIGWGRFFVAGLNGDLPRAG